jgi:HEAT repeat protein
MSPVSLDELVDALSADEPNYPELAKRYGPDALPWLSRLAADNDTVVASRAVALAGLIEGPNRFAIVEAASRRPEERVRIAVAGAAPQLTLDEATTVLTNLLADSGEDIRNAALKAVEAWPNSNLRDRLRPNILALSKKDPQLWLRSRALDVLNAKKPPRVRGTRLTLLIIALIGGILIAYLLFRPTPPRHITSETTDNGTGTTDGEPEVVPLPAPSKGEPLPAPPIK